MVASEDFIDTFFNSISDLHSVRKSLDKEYAAGLVEILKRASKDISDHTGKLLHKLHEKKPDEDTLQAMISASPSSLSYKDEHGDLPIHVATVDLDSVRYVPLLAKEGVKYNVGGEDGRGGLLVQDEDDESALEIISNRYDGNDDKHRYDERCVDVMKELREANLFTKKDVEDYDLLHHTCFAETDGYMLRFEYLSDWCPEGLKKHRFDNLPLIHAIIEQCDEDIGVFATFLKAAAKHHMNEACLLFQYDDDGVTACERAFEKFGKGASIRVIGDCIPFDEPQIPILHHVAKHAPQLLNDFSARYISAVYSRDDNGRNLNQTLLASGKTTFKDDCMYFVRLSDDQVREIDPVTDLYPFMVAASSGISDLSAVYMLLRRNPSLVRSGIKHSNRRRKRKASANNDTKRRNI